MAPGKSLRCMELALACEWDACEFVGKGMEEFCDHVAVHLREHLTEYDSFGELDEYQCLWRGCGFLAVEGPNELVVHVNYHSYHAKLKYLGGELQRLRSDLPVCSLESQNQNLIPEIAETFTCQWEHCDSTFNNPEWFYRHVDMHGQCTDRETLPNKNKTIPCCWKGCDACFRVKFKLREHLRSHTQEKIVSCPNCGGMFSNNTKFYDHVRRQTSIEQKTFPCQHCDKHFANERLLRDHVRNHVNQFKCPLCDMTCTTFSSLRTHIKFRHCDERPYPCDFCENSFKNLYDLRKHIETHSDEPTYHCSSEGCEFTARTVQTLKQHYRKVHEGETKPRYKCHICDKCFAWAYTLTMHLRRSHQLKWPSGHARFRYKENVDGYLQLHMVRYETEELTQQIIKDLEKRRVPPATKPPETRLPAKSRRQALPPEPSALEPAITTDNLCPGQHNAPPPEILPAAPAPVQRQAAQTPKGNAAGVEAAGSESPVYCELRNIRQGVVEEPGAAPGTRRARASLDPAETLEKVARGLGIQIIG
ncbi:histone H4 transcription factor [Callorhinchus milii]|uniref:Zgc:112083 n=1 Tax=Callorhinchus milii TaxID=7868 RepID=A0A4W3IKY5_CALMI|nr:histone H4 transcription factor [Callorhinchus milii]XP_042190645.1 histone H4 transcription factor [Callorhinchus milii]XP_042190646.1 histone H4 transcription factor [Callorhinchus milii]XP_042190647.1 histone H4 transcription factor [Callorhinchus milii]|eukprot:gi/632976606/ref/XP_007904889.1/ PREDICTED: histone H4 transcription factor-like [Callorhinchus milii]